MKKKNEKNACALAFVKKKQYPVLYLIHGLNGYEGSWSERGRAIHILENLVAEGKCEPMILVMPDVNVEIHEDRPSHYTLWKNICNLTAVWIKFMPLTNTPRASVAILGVIGACICPTI